MTQMAVDSLCPALPLIFRQLTVTVAVIRLNELPQLIGADFVSNSQQPLLLPNFNRPSITKYRLSANRLVTVQALLQSC